MLGSSAHWQASGWTHQCCWWFRHLSTLSTSFQRRNFVVGVFPVNGCHTWMDGVSLRLGLMSFCKNTNYPPVKRDDGKPRRWIRQRALCVCTLMLLYAYISLSLCICLSPYVLIVQISTEICTYDSPGMWKRWCSQKHELLNCWTLWRTTLYEHQNTYRHSGTPYLYTATKLTCRTWLQCAARCQWSLMILRTCSAAFAKTLSIQIITTVTVDDLQSDGACLAG